MAAAAARLVAPCCSSPSRSPSFHAFSPRSHRLPAVRLQRRRINNTGSLARASSSSSSSVPPPPPSPPPKEDGGEVMKEAAGGAASAGVKPAAAAASAGVKPAPAAASAGVKPAPPAAKKVSTKPMDIMAFSGPGPETINGRLAMLGFAAALAVEAATGATLADQLSSSPSSGLAWFWAATLVVTAASLVPLLRGVTPDARAGRFMSARAEVWNGRAAMLGLVALAITEYVKQGPLI